MTKWEYIYVEADHDEIQKINGQEVGKYKSLFQGIKGKPSVAKFLAKAGQEGWEVIGLCPASESAIYWRLILKRPIP